MISEEENGSKWLFWLYLMRYIHAIGKLFDIDDKKKILGQQRHLFTIRFGLPHYYEAMLSVLDAAR